MFGWKKRDTQEKQLDSIGRDILRAAALSDEECDEAASSPFLLTRVRARIAAERERREQPSDAWASILPVFRRAIPVMILIAVSAVGASWYVRPVAPVGRSNNYIEPYPDPHNPRMAAVSACAISSRDECAISTEDVLATLVNEASQEKQQ